LRRIFVGSSALLALYHCTNALGAEGLMNFLATFNHSDLLQIWFESTPGSSQRKAAVVTKGRRFSTGIALCHLNFLSLLLLQNWEKSVVINHYSKTRLYHKPYLFSRKAVINRRIKS
jgi:hypothetical protein